MTKHPLIAVFTLAAALAASLALPAAAATAPSPITREQIAAAITVAGVNVSPEQVTLLNNVTTASPAPQLKIESMERVDAHQARVRVGCTQPGDCLPFYVLVQWSKDAALPPALNSGSFSAVAARPPTSSFVVQAGSPAVLLLESDHVHIRLRVICLENGAAGQTIRVASPDRKQTYKAEVMDDSKLRGSL